RSLTMTCYTCDETDECNPPTNCSYGTIKSTCSCGCDDRCASGPGEWCGGFVDWGGTCAEGLECKKEEVVNQWNRWEADGKCVAKAPPPIIHPGTCPPSHKECTDALKGLSIHIPQICSDDAECRFYSKCCFDKCLDHHTCKPTLDIALPFEMPFDGK
ncbi:unnamed protein product, partial [Meganyctiphanes norvegica]